MRDPRCKTMAVRDETPELLFGEDGELTLTAFSEGKRSGFHGFLSELIEAHRYVNNRRAASNAN